MSSIKVKFDVTSSKSASKASDSESNNSTRSGRLREMKRRRRRHSFSSSEEEIDEDEKIVKCAALNNLTTNNIKNIIRKVVSNDQVLAIVKLKAEEMERYKQKEQKLFTKQLLSDSPDGTKLTRLKAKELNHYSVLPVMDLKTPEPDKDVTALIQEDLRDEDDDDEEYEPNEEELNQSDDDTATTYSDIDSQPRTPGEALLTTDNDEEQDIKYDQEGIFKVPKSPFPSKENENIARRTRSKFSLSTTAIETIEKTFIPPDITTDMYDIDTELDNPWQEFLNQFRQPLNAIIHEEDDETDPEYVAADRVPNYAEDSRIKVSKREVQALMNELLEGLDENLTTEFINSFNEEDQEEANKPKYAAMKNELVEERRINELPSSSNCSVLNEFVFYPGIVSTPMKTTSATNLLQPAVDLPNFMVHCADMPQCQPSFQIVLGLDNKLYYCPVTASTVDQSSMVSTVPKVESSNVRDIADILSIDLTAPPKQIMAQIEEKSYSFVGNPEVLEHEHNTVGFSSFQLKILRQQLMMDIQIAAQLFLQFYSHPEFWGLAQKQRNILRELDTMVCPKVEAVCGEIANLKLAIKFCDDWQMELDESTEENRNLIEGYTKRPDKFPIRLMERLVSSKVFCFPQLIPPNPFKIPRPNQSNLFAKSEKYLFPLLFDYYQSASRIPLTIIKLCELVRKDYCPWRSLLSLTHFVSRLRNDKMNPIKYYFQHNRPPTVHHNLNDVDCDRLIAPEDLPKGSLPLLWNRYIFSNERIRRVYYNIFNDTDAASITVRAPSVLQEPENYAKEDDFEQEQGPLAIVIDYNNYKLEFKLPDGASVWNQDPKSVLKPLSSGKPPSYVNHFVGSSVPFISDEVPPFYSRGAAPNDPTLIPSCSNSNASSNNNSLSSHNTSDFALSIIETPKKRIVRRKKFKKITTRKKRTVKFGLRKLLTIKLHKILLHTDQSYNQFITIDVENQIAWKIFCYIKEFDIFASLLARKMKTLSSGRKQKAIDDGDAAPENAETPGKKQKVEEREKGAEALPSIIGQKRYQKAQRLHDNNRLLIMPERGEELLERDSLFAWNFFDKVERTYMAEGNSRKIDKFLSCLTTFKPKKESVADLYYKLEDLFLPDHPELVELFLTFLLPGHAAQVGKFFEQFILTNMQTFVGKLNTYFEKQPSQLRKIYALLNELSASAGTKDGGLTMAKIKQKFLPLLKGNQLLIDWFLQLFPNERASDPQDNEFEVLQVKKTEEGFEEIPPTDIQTDPFDSPACAIKYMQGRIYYGNRVILPADLSFLAVHDSEPDKGSSFSDHKGMIRPESTTCVHAIKSSWDQKVKDDNSDGNGPEPASKDYCYKLCDNTALKMHSNRLNPSSLLSPMDSATSPTTDENQKSPKKSQSSSAGMSHSSGKSKSNSISPKRQSNSSKGCYQSGTPKKSSSNLSESKRKPKSESTIFDSSTDDSSQKSCCWTRDEDKLILEAINRHTDSEQLMVQKLTSLLPERNRDEIRDRFKFLINVLKDFK